MKNLNWKNTLIIWIAVGVLAAGLLNIFPPQEIHHIKYIRNGKKWISDDNNDYRDVTLLITVVGAILIWGLKIYKKDNK